MASVKYLASCLTDCILFSSVVCIYVQPQVCHLHFQLQNQKCKDSGLCAGVWKSSAGITLVGNDTHFFSLPSISLSSCFAGFCIEGRSDAGGISQPQSMPAVLQLPGARVQMLLACHAYIPKRYKQSWPTVK